MRSRSDSATSRRRFLAASTAAVTGAWLSGGEGEAIGVDEDTSPHSERDVKQSNLVIFFPDQLRAESLGCYGHPVVKTPNVDRLAAEATRFSHCVCHPLCAVSRVSMVTGWPAHV